MPNLPRRKNKFKSIAPVAELLCDLCELPRPRKKALAAEVNGRSLFLCADCCCKVGNHRDPAARIDFWLRCASFRGGAA